MARIDYMSVPMLRKHVARFFAVKIRLSMTIIAIFSFLLLASNPAWATSYVLGEPSGTYYGPYNITGSATADPGKSLGWLNAYIDGNQVAHTSCYSANCAIDFQKIYGYLFESLHGSHTYQLAAYDGTVTYSQKQTFFVDRTPKISITSPTGTVYGTYNLSGTVTFTPTRSSNKGTISIYVDNSPGSLLCTTEVCNFNYVRADNQGTHTIRVRAISGGTDVSQTTMFFSEITPTVHITSPETVSPNFDITGTVTFKPTPGTYKGYIFAYLDGQQVASYQTCTTEVCDIKRSAYPIPREGAHTISLYTTTAYPYTANARDSKTINVQACNFSASNTTIDPSVGGNTILSGTVFDAAGKPILWTLTIAGRTFTGTGTTATVTWDGRDSSGRIVEPNIYMATLSTSNNTGGCTDTKTIQVKVIEGPKTCLMNIPFLSSANGASGNLSHNQELFSTKGAEFTTNIALYYNSLDPYTGPLGTGWSHSYDMAVKENSDGSVVLREGGGGRRFYTKSGNGYISQVGDHTTLSKKADGAFVVIYKNGLKYNFDLNGKIASIVGLNNNAINFAYTNGNLTTITDSSGRVTTFTSSADNKITFITDPAGNIYSFDYGGNNLTSVAYPSNSQWSYTYDAAGFMQTKTDPSGNTITYVYDINHRVVTGTDISGRIKSITYPAVTGVAVTTSYTDTNGKVWNYTYDTQNGTLVQKGDPLGGITDYIYDSDRNLISLRDPNNNITRYTYDTLGNMLTKTEAQGTALEKTTTYTYDPIFSKVLTETVKSVVNSTQNKVITNTYDATGNLLTTTETGLLGDGTAYSYTTTYIYDSNGRITKIDGPRTDVQDVTTYTYDTTGNLLSTTLPLIGTTTYGNYDLLGNPGTVTDPNGNDTTYTYDSTGRVLTIKAPGDASATQYFYVSGGCQSCGGGENKIDHIILPEGNTIEYVYDNMGNLLTIKDNSNNSINYTYDSEGNRLKEEIKDAAGALQKTVSYQYDALNRLKRITNPDTKYTEYTYDFNGNRISLLTPNASRTTYQYDALNRLTFTLQPLNASISYTYDTNNNLTSVKNANNNTTSYKYDDRGLVFQVISADTGTTTYSYDAAGNLTSKTDAMGVTISYVYDAANRLSKIDFPTDTDIVYAYDTCMNGKGKLCSMTDESGTTAYEYFPKGQVKKETKVIDGVTYATQYSYDMNGNLKTMTYPSGRVITYNTSNDKVISVLNNAANLATSITYKPFGGMSSLTYGNGITASIGYDNQYRISNITTGTVMKLTYADDANGNITSITNTLDATKNKSFTYDALDRLTAGTGSWGSLAWTYDGVGNRLTENTNIYTYTANTNKLSSANGLTYVFDNNGNTTAEGARSFTYNQNLRLIRVVDASTTKGDYTYNGNGQRVKTVVNGVTTVFHYNLNGQIISGSTGTGLFTAEYVYLNSQPLAKVVGTNAYFYANDHLGTPQKMTNSFGAVVWAADYKPFGEATITVSTRMNNLRFPGQYYDAETGLNYNYFRDYNPVIGRYIERDPIGIQQGDNHLYVYVTNSPLNKIDPRGLYQCTYCVRSHRMVCTPNQIPHMPFDSSRFVSGNNNGTPPMRCTDCQNNPDQDNWANQGPVPDGDYTIGSQRPGSSRRDLTPAWSNDMHGRNAFQIHGCRNTATCSEGCIAATTNQIRDQLNSLLSLEEGDNTLHVQQ